MEIGDKGLYLIAKSEGLSLYAYKCVAGRWTIGYGHTEGVKEGDAITQGQAVDLLKKDIAEVEAYLNKLGWDLTQNQFDALCSLIFNIGIKAFNASTLKKKIQAGEDVKSEWSRWVYVGKKRVNGLVERRIKEIELFCG